MFVAEIREPIERATVFPGAHDDISTTSRKFPSPVRHVVVFDFAIAAFQRRFRDGRDVRNATRDVWSERADARVYSSDEGGPYRAALGVAAPDACLAAAATVAR